MIKTILRGALGFLFLVTATCNVEKDNNPVNVTIPPEKTQPSYGSFNVSLIAPTEISQGYTSILGMVKDGPTPEKIIWDEKTKIGNCRLLVPRIPFCEESCAGGVCVEDDSCQPNPSKIEVGTVTASGLKTKTGETTFSMMSVMKNYQPTAGVTVDFPPCAEGDTVTFTASGTETMPAFTLTAVGISPLEILNDTIKMEDGKPIQLRWVKPAKAGNSTIEVIVDISHHGGIKGLIECKCEDNGFLEIPASLLKELKDLGVAGFPEIEIVRKSVGTSDTAPADLIIESRVTKFIEIPGVISCTGETCPDGKSCKDFMCQ